MTHLHFQKIKANTLISSGYPYSLNLRNFCQAAWFKKQEHIKLHKHKNKWVTSKSGAHYNDPHCREIFECKTATQVKSILENAEMKHEWVDINSHSDYHLYTVALRKLIDLQQFKECWALFNDFVSRNIINLSIYNTMIYLCVQRRNKYALKQALILYNEMTDKYSLSPDLITYTNLISLCAAVAAWDKADNFWKILIDSNDINIDLSAYNTMIDCYVKSNRMDQAIELFKQLRNSPKLNDRSLKPDSFTYSILISAFAKQQKIELAEKLFILAIKDWGKLCDINVYQPLIDGYSQIGDIQNALKLFNLLLLKHDINKAFSSDIYISYNDNDKLMKNILKYNEELMFPRINTLCFNAIFKGFTKMKDNIHNNIHTNDKNNVMQYLLNADNCWKLIEYLLIIMDNMEIKRSSITYGILFHLCDYQICFDVNNNINNDIKIDKNALKRARQIYKEMNDDDNVVLRTDIEMCNFLRTALNVLKYDKNEKLKFVEWWLEEIKNMKISKSDYAIKSILQNGIKLSEINLAY